MAGAWHQTARTLLIVVAALLVAYVLMVAVFGSAVTIEVDDGPAGAPAPAPLPR